ncbi:hypothetical protein DPX16_2099 [Anabarilius grahami]|uniref:Uncharacterized protein n=1 Tax=Anabarilius grahami TaxID=495550 RepID=A0A3N0Y2G8_ANAGA|nr:hypothetical protein DPX16_2099 [Anabarilius grahami]
MDTSGILGRILSKESPDEILDHYTEDSYPTQLVRRSSRIAARNPFSINEWPKERILATLYSLNVHMPPNLNHDQLLTFLQEVNQDPQPPSTNVVKPSNPSQAPAQQGDDRVLTALLSIQGTLSDMDNRIQALESQRLASTPQRYLPLPPGCPFSPQQLLFLPNCALKSFQEFRCLCLEYASSRLGCPDFSQTVLD